MHATLCNCIGIVKWNPLPPSILKIFIPIECRLTTVCNAKYCVVCRTGRLAGRLKLKPALTQKIPASWPISLQIGSLLVFEQLIA